MWAIFDLETTGLDVKNDRVIEYGVVLYEPRTKKLMATSSQLVYEAGIKVSDEITEITGIDLTMLANRSCSYQRMCEILASFFSNEDVTHIVAHRGADFDVPMLQMEFIRLQSSMPQVALIDTYVDVPWPKSSKSKSLPYLCADHGFLNPWPHRALPDAMSLMSLVMKYDHQEIERRAASPTVTLLSKASYEERDKPKAAGFQWNPTTKQWTKTLKMIDYDDLKDKLNFSVQQVMGSV